MAYSEMEQRVAKAILAEQEKEAFPNNLNLARAAIEAMREPTKAMNQAGRQKAYYLGAYLGDGAMALVWREMIDAALSPQARKDETT